MSALLVDDLIVQAPSAEPTGWRHVRGREFVPQLTLVPEVGPVPAPVQRPRANGSDWQLTDRGIKVVVTFFLALFATAVVVMASSFLAVSNEPIAVPAPPAAVSALD